MLANGVLPIPQFPFSSPQLIVAHFDHGIREDSAHDTEFVADLAKKYNLSFEMERQELGKNASEELARDRRYEFLRRVAKKYDAKIITAHHADDVIETIAINIIRGTGWRGLTVMDSDIVRPLTGMYKSEILDYAKVNNLDWREDSTNASQDYLRNRVRQILHDFDEDKKWQLLGLWAQQKYLKKQIDEQVAEIIDGGPTYDRYFFIQIDDKSSIECLRKITEARLTRPQLQELSYAIKTYEHSKTFQAGNGIIINFSSRNFTVELLK